MVFLHGVLFWIRLGFPGSYSFLGDGMILNVTYSFTALTSISDLEAAGWVPGVLVIPIWRMGCSKEKHNFGLMGGNQHVNHFFFQLNQLRSGPFVTFFFCKGRFFCFSLWDDDSLLEQGGVFPCQVLRPGIILDHFMSSLSFLGSTGKEKIPS